MLLAAVSQVAMDKKDNRLQLIYFCPLTALEAGLVHGLSAQYKYSYLMK